MLAVCRSDPNSLPGDKASVVATSSNAPQTLDLSRFGAGNEVRTRDLDLGKVALYQMSYSRVNIYDLITFPRYFIIEINDKKAAKYIP